MFFWLIPIGISVVFLSWFLIKALRQYERESVYAAFERLSALEAHLHQLNERVEILETIESDQLLKAEKSKEMPKSAESLSSGRKPVIE